MGVVMLASSAGKLLSRTGRKLARQNSDQGR